MEFIESRKWVIKGFDKWDHKWAGISGDHLGQSLPKQDQVQQLSKLMSTCGFD